MQRKISELQITIVMYLGNEDFITKVMQHVHQKNKHLGIAHTIYGQYY